MTVSNEAVVYALCVEKHGVKYWLHDSGGFQTFSTDWSDRKTVSSDAMAAAWKHQCKRCHNPPICYETYLGKKDIQKIKVVRITRRRFV
jgi:hypothetical protein